MMIKVSASTSPARSDPSAPDVADLRDRLETLGARVNALEPGKPLDHLVTRVAEAVERLTQEHAGMAEELLSVYEQLGVVFEVTRKLAAVHTEADVVDWFVDSLQRSFATRGVTVERRNTVRRNENIAQPDAAESWIDTVVRRAVDQDGVIVEHPADPTKSGGIAEVLVGSVSAGEFVVCAMVLTRRVGSDPFRSSDMLLLESLTNFCGDLIRSHRLVHELRDMSIAMVRSLVNAVDQKDKYTSGHSLRVGYYATLLGRALGLQGIELQMLQWSALLHDVGKIGIRDDVLKKSGKLTEEEFNHIKEHPVRSHKVVEGIPQLHGALDGVLHHHEHFDGSGYPGGLKGEHIPLQARIVQIADVFDALTSNRSYRKAYRWDQALDILAEEAGKTVDPRIQQVFDRTIRSLLEHRPDGWEKLTQRANRFSEIGQAPNESAQEN